MRCGDVFPDYRCSLAFWLSEVREHVFSYPLCIVKLADFQVGGYPE
jgi:hypothetical protein